MQLNSHSHQTNHSEQKNRQTIWKHSCESNRKLTIEANRMAVMGKMCLRRLVDINGFSQILV